MQVSYPTMNGLSRRRLALLALTAACLQAEPARAQTTTALTTAPASALTAVPVYLPGYGPDSWSVLRGSVIGSVSGETAYTIFCDDQSSQSCELQDQFPFTFAEGPTTLHFQGISPGTITADLSCQLAGTTAATCTGFSSYGEGYSQGHVEGPTETTWTSTFTGTDVDWGVLTLSSLPTVTATSGGADGASGAPSDGSPSDSSMFFTSAGPTGAAESRAAPLPGRTTAITGPAWAVIAMCLSMAIL